MLWFASLVESLSTAVFATLIQEWVRRYLVLTQPLYSSHKNARIRAFLILRGSLATFQRTVNYLHGILHQSIFPFLIGLITLTSGGGPFIFVVVILYITLPVLLYLRFSWTPVFHPHSLFSTPLSGFLLSLRTIGLSLFRAISRRGGIDGTRRDANAPAEVAWLTWAHTVSEIEQLAETHSSTLDTWAISWLLLSLSREQEMEQFLAGIPSFYKSTRVENPTEVLRESNTNQLPKAIVGFIDHSLTFGLVPDTTRRRRISVSLKAIQADSYLLQRTFYHALGFIESAVFTSVDFVLLADQYINDDDPYIRFLARCIIAVAINRLGDCHADELWAGIVQRGLNWSESSFAEYREQRDSIQLRNLIQLARELNAVHPGCDDPSTRTIFGYTLCAARQLKVEKAALELQHEFCDLWNWLVALDVPRQRPVDRSNAIFTLSLIRNIYVTLHQGTTSRSFALAACTDDLDPVLQKASSYPHCTVSSHVLPPFTNPNANVSAYDSDA